jgi:hypothetical protein
MTSYSFLYRHNLYGYGMTMANCLITSYVRTYAHIHPSPLKGIFLIILFVSVLACIIIFLERSNFNINIKPIQFFYKNKTVKSQTNNKTFKIVFLTSFYTGKNWFGIGQEPFKDCRFKNCLSVSDRNNYNDSDAALLSLCHTPPGKQGLPTWKPPGQIWVMWLLVT